MELRDYVRVLRKRWRLVVLLPLITLLGAGFLTARAVPTYQTSTTFFVSTSAGRAEDSSAAYTGGLFSQQRVKSYADLLSGKGLAKRVSANLSLPLSEVEGHITANVKTDTVLLTATVTDTSRQRAVDIANQVGKDFPQLVQQLEQPPGGGTAAVRAAVVESPPPAAQVSPQPVRNGALALVLGLLLGVGAAVVRELLDSTVKTADDVRRATGAAVIGAIAFDSKIAKRPLVVQDAPRAPRSEAFRQLRTNLQFVGVDHGLRSVVVTSSLPSEAKSTSACNLAITLAQAGSRVMLIEGDLRRPRIADYLGIEGAVGLTNVLIGQHSVEDAVQPWGDMGLHVLASGPLPPNPAELLGSSGMRQLMKQLQESYDVVIVDAPPLLPVTDAAILATMTSGALMCVRMGQTRQDELSRAAESLSAVGATTLGVLMTMVPTRGPSATYAYGYGYGYGEYKSDQHRPQLDETVAHNAARTTAVPVPPAVPDEPQPSAPLAPPTPEAAPTAESVTPESPHEPEVQSDAPDAAVGQPSGPRPGVATYQVVSTSGGSDPRSVSAAANADRGHSQPE